jgi:tetratricopeptide (TPR) repeat protein
MGGGRSRWFLGLWAVVAALGGGTWLLIRDGRDPDDDPFGRGVSAYHHGDWQAAAAEARAILKARPSDDRALRLLARASARLGRDDSAEAIYRKLGTGRMEAEDLFLLGRGLLRRGLTGPALASLGAARDAQPDHAETLDALAQYWAESRSLTDAADAAERLMRQPGWEVRGALRLGRLRLDLFDPAGAARLLAGALERDPDLDRAGIAPHAARMLLARALLQDRRPAEARAALQEASSGPGDPEAAWLLSRALLQEGHGAEAGAALTRAGGFGTGDPMLPEPAPFVGAATCAACHPGEFRAQQASRHARTLRRTDELTGLPWPDRAVVDPNNPRVAHRLGRVGDRVEAEARVDGRVLRAVVTYALGSNRQGQSYLARDEAGQVRELRIARYPRAPEWDRTMEHPAVPLDAAGYLGRPVSPESVRKCLHCHATHFRDAGEPDDRPEGRDRGIGCERCHGPGGHHRPAIEAHLPEPAIARPRLASAARVVALCADCHSAPPATTPADAGFIRYQASGFVLSRCYTGSGEAFGCVTCHDPHQDAATSAASYEAKCLDCHSASGSPAPGPRATSGSTGPTCPINPRRDCLACHMPRVEGAVPRTVFTDHQIRVRPAP